MVINASGKQSQQVGFWGWSYISVVVVVDIMSGTVRYSTVWIQATMDQTYLKRR